MKHNYTHFKYEKKFCMIFSKIWYIGRVLLIMSQIDRETEYPLVI